MSTVDVVIHCYNCGHYLQSCVASVLFQAGVDVRVLIVDDASTDNTAEIGRELAAFGLKVDFRRHEVRRGDLGIVQREFKSDGRLLTTLRYCRLRTC